MFTKSKRSKVVQRIFSLPGRTSKSNHTDFCSCVKAMMIRTIVHYHYECFSMLAVSAAVHYALRQLDGCCDRMLKCLSSQALLSG